jgi:hypothetical protein
MSDILTALQSARPSYQEEGTWMRFLIDAYHGSGGFQGRIKQPPAGYWGHAAEAYASFSIPLLISQGMAMSGGEKCSYIDRHVREDADEYSRRVQFAHYPNYCRPTTNLKVSYITRKPHTRANVPPELQKWIDRTGYDKSVRRRVLSAAVLGWFPAIVDKPRPIQGAITAAQAGNLDPYVIAALPCSLLSYQVDEVGKFVWAKTVTKQNQMSWDGSSTEVKRYTVWTRKNFTAWDVVSVNGGNPEIRALGEFPHDFGAVPVVSWRAEMDLEDPVRADSVMADIATENRRLFNLVNELDDHIRCQVFALLVWPRRSQDNAAVEIGNNNGVNVDPDAKNMPFYLAPPASCAATLEERIKESIVEIYRMARVEYDKASGTRSSAQSKEQNFEQTNLAIVDFARSVAQADHDTLTLVGRGMGVSESALEKMTCSAHDTYATEGMADEIDQVMQLVSQSIGMTAKSELLKRVVFRALGSGASADVRTKIESEISADLEKAEKERELAAVALIADDGDDDDDDDASAKDGGDADPADAA